jgi:hypothetical protein
MAGVFRYVPHDEFLFRLIQGWHWVADLGDVHAEYASLMKWCGGDCGGEFAP